MSVTNQAPGSITLSDGSPLDPLIVDILASRNVSEGEEMIKFLEPKLKDLPDPFLMKDMETAVKIITDGLARGAHITVVGDYDVDGTTGTALLLKFFNYLGASVSSVIPNRLTEGYGLQSSVLDRVRADRADGLTGKKILITVDNGISAHEAIELAKRFGYQVIVTDHHTPPRERVSADAVLNPKQKECLFPEKNLAGVGVAFYLAMGIRAFLRKDKGFNCSRAMPNLKQFLDLVAIGTVSDMVPLTGVNRILVRAGMETIASGSNHGIAALCDQSNVDHTFVRSEDISFQLAPKINAAGRLGQAEKAVELFGAQSYGQAKGLACELIDLNIKRKNCCIDDMSKVMSEVGVHDQNFTHTIVVSGDYHVGVAGIVASNLVESFDRVSVVLCNQGDGIYKGSARSVPGIDLYKVLEKCEKLLLGYGGHPMAGGLSIRKENLAEFRKIFDQAAGEYGERVVGDGAKFVADVAVEKLFSKALLQQLHTLEPFGEGNPQPIFRDRSCRFKEVTTLGKDKEHLKMLFCIGNTTIKGVAFGFGKYVDQCRNNQIEEIFYTPSVNFFRGNRSWQVRVTEITLRQQLPESA